MGEKEELIHLHGLFAELADHAEDELGISVDRDDHEAVGVKPNAIHKTKDDHKEALFALSAATSEAFEEAEVEAPTPA